MMALAAAYDEIADWYEQEFLPSTAAAAAHPLGTGALTAPMPRGCRAAGQAPARSAQ
jgi:hypothetical protein